jgi:hypothetical protein
MSTAGAAGFRDLAVAPGRHRHAVAQGLMRECLVVKGEPFADAGSGFAAIGVAHQGDVLVLQRTPQP